MKNHQTILRMTIIFNAEIQIQYFCYFSFGVSILFCLSFLNGLSQTDAVCGISSEIRSSFRISLIFIQICYSKQSYCYKRLSIYLCSRQQYEVVVCSMQLCSMKLCSMKLQYLVCSLYVVYSMQYVKVCMQYEVVVCMQYEVVVCSYLL